MPKSNQDNDRPLKATDFTVCALFVAVLSTLLLMYPALRNHSEAAGFMYTGDILGFYWPSLRKLTHLISNGHFTAIDFDHFNGSSDFFLAPNFFSVHPLFVLLALLSRSFEVDAVVTQRWIVWALAGSILVSIYYTIRTALRFLKWDVWQASLAGVCYGCSIYFVTTIGEPTYLLCCAPMPCITYYVLTFIDRPSKRSLFVASIPIVSSILGGYLPLGFASAGIGIALAWIVLWSHGIDDKPARSFAYALTSVPLLAAAIIVGPFLAASYRFIQASPSSGRSNLFYSAHQLADSPQAILRAVSSRFVVQAPFNEGSVYIGMLGVAILAMFGFRRSMIDGVGASDLKLLRASVCMFALSALATYGDFSPVSDIVFYFVPQVGGMHIYQRFLLLTNIFYCLILSICLQTLYKCRRPETGRISLLLSLLAIMVVGYLLGTMPETALKAGLSAFLLFELFTVAIFVIIYRLGGRNFGFACCTCLMAMPAFDANYDWSKGANDLAHNTERNPIALSRTVQAEIVKFMRKHSSKSVIKYVDLTPMWSLPGATAFPKSFPYWVGDHIHLSSYHGFNFYLSTRNDYMKQMPVGGQLRLAPNWDWVAKTGADFVIRNKGDGGIPEGMESSDRQSHLDLPGNLTIIPLRQIYYEVPDVFYDSGVFRVVRQGAVNSDSRFVQTKNVALGRKTRHSSQMGSAASGVAVDGNRNGNFFDGSVFHSLGEGSPWLEVDLGTQTSISGIQLWPRTDCCPERINNSWLFVSAKPFKLNATVAELNRDPSVISRIVTSATGPRYTYTADIGDVRYVRLQAEPSASARILQLAEIEVFRSVSDTAPTKGVAHSISAPKVKEDGNYANELTLEIDNGQAVTVEYLMAYNPGLHFYCDGVEIIPEYGPGTVARITLRPGRHSIKVMYRNPLLMAFWFVYSLYGGLLAVLVAMGSVVGGYGVWKSFRRANCANSSNVF